LLRGRTARPACSLRSTGSTEHNTRCASRAWCYRLRWDEHFRAIDAPAGDHRVDDLRSGVDVHLALEQSNARPEHPIGHPSPDQTGLHSGVVRIQVCLLQLGGGHVTSPTRHGRPPRGGDDPGRPTTYRGVGVNSFRVEDPRPATARNLPSRDDLVPTQPAHVLNCAAKDLSRLLRGVLMCPYSQCAKRFRGMGKVVCRHRIRSRRRGRLTRRRLPWTLPPPATIPNVSDLGVIQPSYVLQDLLSIHKPQVQDEANMTRRERLDTQRRGHCRYHPGRRAVTGEPSCRPAAELMPHHAGGSHPSRDHVTHWAHRPQRPGQRAPGRSATARPRSPP